MICIEEDCGGDCLRRGRNKDGYNWKCRACGQEFRVKTKPRPELMTGDPCKICGGPTASNNRTGICTLNPQCRKQWYAEHDGKSPGLDPKLKDRKQGRYPARAHELYEDMDDDGEMIVDDIAIQLCIQAVRKVRLTPTEQGIATRKMIRMDFSTGDIRDRLGVTDANLKEILDTIGYEVIKDPAMKNAKWSERKLIARKDRVRGYAT